MEGGEREGDTNRERFLKCRERIEILLLEGEVRFVDVYNQQNSHPRTHNYRLQSIFSQDLKPHSMQPPDQPRSGDQLGGRRHWCVKGTAGVRHSICLELECERARYTRDGNQGLCLRMRLWGLSGRDRWMRGLALLLGCGRNGTGTAD